MHPPADDPLLFCEAPNAVPWSHLFGLDYRRFLHCKKTVCLILDPGLGWNWNLEYGLSSWMIPAVYFCVTCIQIKNATMSQDHSLVPTAM